MGILCSISVHKNSYYAWATWGRKRGVHPKLSDVCVWQSYKRQEFRGRQQRWLPIAQTQEGGGGEQQQEQEQEEEEDESVKVTHLTFNSAVSV